VNWVVDVFVIMYIFHYIWYQTLSIHTKMIVYIHIHAHLYTYMYLHVYIYMYTYICTYIYIAQARQE